MRIAHDVREARYQIRQTLGWGDFILPAEVEALRAAEAVLDRLAAEADEARKRIEAEEDAAAAADAETDAEYRARIEAEGERRAWDSRTDMG